MYASSRRADTTRTQGKGNKARGGKRCFGPRRMGRLNASKRVEECNCEGRRGWVLSTGFKLVIAVGLRPSPLRRRTFAPAVTGRHMGGDGGDRDEREFESRCAARRLRAL